MKQIITLFSILFLVTSCSKDDPKKSEVPLTQIGKGDDYNESYKNSKANLVIKDQTEWNNLLDNLPPNTVKNLTEKNIDFTKYQIIAAFDQVRNGGGYSIDITSVTENDSNIIIKIENLSKGNWLAVITQPFHIIKIPKSGKNVVFK